MNRSPETSVFLDESIRPMELIDRRNAWGTPLSVVLDTGEVKIPCDINCIPFNIDGRRVKGVFSVYAHSFPHILNEYGLAEIMPNYDSNHETGYRIQETDINYFKRLVFKVKLPDVNKWAESYPWRYDLVHNQAIGFRFFGQPDGTTIAKYAGDKRSNLRRIKNALPALVLPPSNWALLEEERGMGFLTVKPDKDYQKKIEVQFALMEPDQVKCLKYDPSIVIPVGWENEGPWAGSDWSERFGNYTVTQLQAAYRELSDNLANRQTTTEEVEFMRENLLEEGFPTDSVTAVQHLFMLQVSYLSWIERELSRRFIIRD